MFLLPKTFATPTVELPNKPGGDWEEDFDSLVVCSLLAPNTFATLAEELPNKLGGTVKDLGSLGVTFAPNKFALFDSPELNREGFGAVRLLGAPNIEDFTIAEPFDPPNRGFGPVGIEDVPVTPNPGEVKAPGGGIPNRPVLGAFFFSGGENLLPLPKMLILKESGCVEPVILVLTVTGLAQTSVRHNRQQLLCNFPRTNLGGRFIGLSESTARRTECRVKL